MNIPPKKPKPINAEYLDRLEFNAQICWQVTVTAEVMLWLIAMTRKQMEREARDE